METQPIVYIIDDDPSIRRVLRQFLSEQGLPTTLFASAEDFLAQVRPTWAGCILLDVRMPGMSGLELQTALRERDIYLPIVFMTAHADVPMTVRAMKSGATDFVEKPFNEQQLLDTVHAALREDQHRHAARSAAATIDARLRTLTHRERQVLERVVAGDTNRQIADRWHISEKTVKIHRGRVMEKMHAASLAELVLLAQRAGVPTTKGVSE